MKIKVGDKIKFLNEAGQGTVTKIVSKDTALVLGSDGFEVPYMINELLIIENSTDYTTLSSSSSSNETEQEAVVSKSVEEEPEYTNSTDVNLYLAYVPTKQDDLTNSDIDAYIINDSNYFIFYNYAKKQGENYVSLTGVLEPNMKNVLETINNNEIDEKLEVSMQVVFFDKQPYSIREPFSNHIKIGAVKFYKEGSFKENDFFDEFAMLITIMEENLMQKAIEKLADSDIEKVKLTKARKNGNKEFKKVENKNLLEVDLHIEELVDNEAGMSNNDKLDLQRNTFNKEMRRAIKEKYKKVVFIHGVGNGVLKLEIRRELQRAYRGYQFQDASFKEYGFGATMVLLKR